MTIHLGMVEKIGHGIVVTGTLLFLVGCGNSDGLNRIPIYGEIQGAVGRQGSITLVPQAENVPAATVAIIDGAYRFDETNGPLPGDYEAIIAFDTAPEPEIVVEAPTGPDDKVVEVTKRRGRAYVSFDVQIDEKRVPLSVSEEEPLEVNIDLP